MFAIISSLCLFIFCVSDLYAQNTEPSYEDKESARIHFEAAKKLYKSDKYSEALELFMKAYSRFPRPEILYNIGKCYEKLGDYQNAIKFYEQYVMLNLQAEDKEEVEELIRNLKEAIKRPEERDKYLKKDSAKTRDKIIGYSLASAGLLFIALGPVFYLKADSVYNDVKEKNYSEKKREEKIDEIHFYDNLSVASYITGGLLAGASVYFLYKGYSGSTALLVPLNKGLVLTLSGDF
ncbi:MAG: tetratricopeptide repeat protein [Deltaproteobacteria bacterium]|nr:tetratricopeptide repeat protein [Deltaproteobacteria bacterium]